MVSKNEKDFIHTNKELMKVEEKKINNAQSLSKHHRLEETLHEIRVREVHIKQRLFDKWKKDPPLIRELDDVIKELDYNDRSLQKELAEKQEHIYDRKRKLIKNEEQLLERKRSVGKESS